MTPFAFDTLSASKRLREAGMEEGVAEAVVSVFQHTATMPDISHLATRDDVGVLRKDLDALGVDVRTMKAEMATKRDLETLRAELRNDILATEARLLDVIRQQGWALLGGMAVLLTISTVLGRVIP